MLYQEREPVAGAAAVILTGGKSSRMGRPKALLPFGGEPLVVHLIQRLEMIFKEIVVVAAAGQELPPLRALIVRDELPFKGPVAGIYYGLRASGADFAFVTSCDAPFLNLELVRFLTSRITGWDVVAPYWEERFQPLHAVYRTELASLLAQQLARDELRPVTLYERVRTLKISAEEIRRFDPAGLSFMNMNTPEDYQAALALWEASNT
jgi:molybdopterin-guanine dinucleotide biosynthesis protein A